MGELGSVAAPDAVGGGASLALDDQVFKGRDGPQYVRAVVGVPFGPLGGESQMEGDLLDRVFEFGGVLGVEDKVAEHCFDADADLL